MIDIILNIDYTMISNKTYTKLSIQKLSIQGESNHNEITIDENNSRY